MNSHAVFGDAARIDEMRGNSVKGNLALSRRWYLAEHSDPATIALVMDSVHPAAQRLLERNVMPSSWHSFGDLMDIDEAIVRYAMGGEVARMKEFGYELGRHDLRGVYRAFLAVTSPQFALAKVTALGSMYFKDSTLGFELMAPGDGWVRLVGRCMPLYMCTYGITGWLNAVLEAARAQRISVVHSHCVHRGEHACVWKCGWLTSGNETTRGSSSLRPQSARRHNSNFPDDT
jgi:hypothetical protein